MVAHHTDFGFQGKHASEHYQFHYYHHWVKFVAPFMVLTGVYSVIIASFLTFNLQVNAEVAMRQTILWVSVVAILFFNFNFLRLFLKRFLHLVVVTDKMVHRIRKTLVFRNDHRSIDLQSVQEVKKIQHGLLPNMLDYGQISIEAQETTLDLHYVPNISSVYERLLQLQNNARTKALHEQRTHHYYQDQQKPVPAQEPAVVQ